MEEFLESCRATSLLAELDNCVLSMLLVSLMWFTTFKNVTQNDIFQYSNLCFYFINFHKFLPSLHSWFQKKHLWNKATDKEYSSVSTLSLSHLFQAYGWNYYAEFALHLFTTYLAALKFVSINLAFCPIGLSTTLANIQFRIPTTLQPMTSVSRYFVLIFKVSIFLIIWF